MAPQSNSLAQLKEETRDENIETSPDLEETAHHHNGNGRHLERASSSFAMRDADDFLNEDEAMNNLKWKKIAANVDDVSRFWFPFIYTITLAIILAEIT